MGLRNTIADAARAGFSAIGDLAESIVYTQTIKGAYDPQAGATWGDAAVSYTAPAVIEDYKAIEIDGAAIRAGDLKATVMQADLPVAPDTDGRVTRGGQTYRVIAIGADPAGALWIMQLRSA